MPFAFPISLDVTGRRCAVFGGGPLALTKALALLDAGADVTVVSATPCDELRHLAQALRLVERAYEPGDLEGVFLAIVTGEDDAGQGDAGRGEGAAKRIWQEAEARGVLMNALDDVPHCHFAFPAIVRRGDLRVAISTAGKAPALAKQLRERLEREIGPEYGVLVDVLADVRESILPRRVPFRVWAQRWGRALSDLDGLLSLVARGRVEEARQRVLRSVAPDPSVAPDRVADGAGERESEAIRL